MATHEVFAYLHVKNAAAAIDYYIQVFGAKEQFRLAEPSGRIGHAQLDFNGTVVMLADEFPELGIRSPQTVGATTVTIHLHVDNADEVVERAVKAGATINVAVADRFYGERSGSIIDPFGHRWNIGHSIEAVDPKEMQERYTTLKNEAGEP